MPPNADRFHALIRGDARGPLARAARAGLWWARLPYGVGVAVRNRLFDRSWRAPTRVPVPVVSVGNLTLGGTGKTPCVEAVARFYRELGLQVAILSRGYGNTAGRNDEAMVLEENLPDVPHLQGPNRAALARTAVEELESEVLILDDGFQHRRLARDLDIVLADATRPLRDEYLFPRGLLREPVGSLRRAGLVILTRTDQATPESVAAQRDWLRARFPALPVVNAVHAPIAFVSLNESRDLAELRGRPVAGFCGIGNPAAFRRTLADLGANVTDFRTYPDHHPYTREDVDHLQTWAARLPPDAIIATTQKDFVKLRLPDLAGRPLGAVRIGMRFPDGEETLHAKLTDAISTQSESA
jgi:tetraacyldisaccharide 4'-kinase